ncbi:MAG: hypothetical protein LBM06_01100 [Prevotellaceae bacterium]|jgi:hypothetical protein|nr:hypothetical protein [Prevotellaceae bacterium]
MKKIVISAFVALFAIGAFTACQSGTEEASAIVGNYTGTMTSNYLGTLGGDDGPIPTVIEDPYTIAINMNPFNLGEFFVGVVTFKIGEVTIPAINLPCAIVASGGGYVIQDSRIPLDLTIKGHEVTALDVSGTISSAGTLELKLEYRLGKTVLAQPIVNATFVGNKE